MRARLAWQDWANRSASGSSTADARLVGVSGNLIFDANFRCSARLSYQRRQVRTVGGVPGSGGRRGAWGGWGPPEWRVPACVRVLAAACAPLAAAGRRLGAAK